MILFKSRCYNGGRKHNFEERRTEQDRSPHVPFPDVKYLVTDAPEIAAQVRDMNILSVYVGDICTWCGETRKP